MGGQAELSSLPIRVRLSKHLACKYKQLVVMVRAEAKVMKSTMKGKRKTRDLDEVESDMLAPEKKSRLLNQELDLDVTGGAQHYCLHCSRYFVDAPALKAHFRTKPHK